MPFSADTSLVCYIVGNSEADRANFNYSETPVPHHHQVQEYAAGWRANQGHGPTMDVKHQLVFPVHLWSSVCLCISARERQWYVFPVSPLPAKAFS